MTEPKKRENAGTRAENIFSIVDRLVYQIDRTKKFILIIFLLIGARQWMLLSDWTRKYKAYEESRKRSTRSLTLKIVMKISSTALSKKHR